jgi:hypothetical protein
MVRRPPIDGFQFSQQIIHQGRDQVGLLREPLKTWRE